MMHGSVRQRVRTSLILAVAGAAAAPQSAPAEAGAPDTITLSGVVRDFQERTALGGHPDFELPSGVSSGHWVGNVAHFLSADGKPVYIGAGRRVDSAFRDADGRSVAPHLMAASSVSLPPVGDAALLGDGGSPGAYTVELVGVSYNADGSSSWRYRVSENAGAMDISHFLLALHPSQTPMAGTTPGFDFGIDGSTGVHGVKWDLDDAFSDGEFLIVLDGHFAGHTRDNAVLAKSNTTAARGALFSPSRAMLPDPSAAAFPIESGDAPYNAASGDAAGALGDANDGFVDSAASFDQWFRDVPGVNLSRPLELTFQREADGAYVFDDRVDPDFDDLGGFFPINGELFGNSAGESRNYHFTFEMSTEFIYHKGEGQVFTFRGDDDVWVYIDGRLVIDIGGVHNAVEQTIDLDRLGWLEDGETYPLAFFFAERNRVDSNFRIETTINLRSGDLPATSGLFD